MDLFGTALFGRTVGPGRWSRPRLRSAFVLVAVLAPALMLALAGCSNAPAGTPVIDEKEAALPKIPRTMRVTSAFGGSHRQLIVDGNLWYQTFANRVLILDSQSGTLISDVELSPRGTTGPATGIVLRGSSLFAVLEGDAVVEVSVEQPRMPRFVARWGRPELGMAPTHVSLVAGAAGDEVFVSGDLGVLRLSEAKAEGTSFDERRRPIPPVPPARMLDGRPCTAVVPAEGGPVTCVGRRVLRLDTGDYLGAASMLLPLADEHGGGFAFALQASEGAEVGLLGANFRERSSSAVRGIVRAIRVIEDRLVVVNEFEVATWKLEPTAGPGVTSTGEGIQLGTSFAVAVRGAVDVGQVKRNRFAVAGSFGRSLYRFLPEGDKPGDTFYWSERQPGRLDVCVSDRRRVLASGVEGNWMYLIGEKAELVTRDLTSVDPQNAKAEVAWGSASFDKSREEVSVRIRDRSLVQRPSRPGLVSTLASADGKIWIGHDHGIDVLGYDPVTDALVSEDRIVLAGPVVAIYPNRVGGGVTYVARFDGFGVIRPIEITAPPIQAQGTVCGYRAATPPAVPPAAGGTP